MPRFTLRKQITVLIIIWIVLQFVFLNRFGIVTGFESEKYITEAHALLQTGHYKSGNFLFYSTEILLIAFSYVTHTFPWLVVAVQMLANGISVYLFYKLSFYITKDRLKSFLATAFFLSQYYYHLYNVHLFTESLYFSFGIIYTWLLFSVNKLSVKNIVLLVLGLVVLYFTRPTGLFFIPSTIFFIVFKFYRRNAKLILSGLFVMALGLLYFLLNFALNSGGEFDFLLPYLDERVICGVATISGRHSLHVPVEKNSVEGLFYIITHYPGLFFSLAGRRLLTFFGVVRPFFSIVHNIFVAAYFYTAYILAAVGFKKMVSTFLPQTIYLLSNIFFVTITVMLSCDEWHNRFILAVLPFFLLLASGALINKDGDHVK
ncbi:MAG: hypothetical protein ACXVBX_10320 [Flavisolibacter sp.]